MASKKKFQGGLYPSVAVSDAVNTVAHTAAAMMAKNEHPDQPAWLGFGLVAVAAAVGTARFGFSESLFAGANEDLAALAAYVGLPLVGYTFGVLSGLWGAVDGTLLLTLTLAGAALSAVARSLPAGAEEFVKIFLNVILFTLPTGHYGWKKYASSGDPSVLIAVIVFALAGVAIKPDRHRRLLGVRREDWFHYMIASASYVMAGGLRE